MEKIDQAMPNNILNIRFNQNPDEFLDYCETGTFGQRRSREISISQVFRKSIRHEQYVCPVSDQLKESSGWNQDGGEEERWKRRIKT